MSQDAVEVVRRFNDLYEGQDLMPTIREAVARFGPEPDPAAVLAWWADDPSWRHVDEEVEWDTSSIGGVGHQGQGPTGGRPLVGRLDRGVAALHVHDGRVPRPR